jgi:hypothetical protein
MRFASLLVAALLIHVSSSIAGEPRQITIRVFDTASVPDQSLANAQQIVDEVYERIGIRIHWLRGDRETLRIVERETPVQVGRGCSALDSIDIKIQASMRGTIRTSILAKAYPFRRSGIRVHVPMVQLFKNSVVTGVPIDVLLGFVLAHEIGHILIGSDSHSSSGIMRSELAWSSRTPSASQVPLFAASDGNFIRGNLERWETRCPAVIAAR